MKKLVLKIGITTFLLGFVGIAKANNIEVTNSSIVEQNTGGKYTHIKFDVSWENSWKTSSYESNWDAAYVFVKFRLPPSNIWQHATINYIDGTAVSDGHTEPTGGTINATSDGKGAFVYKDSDGIGHANYSDVKLRWNYGIDGLNDHDSVEICVFAIEMVYVPEGAFYVGDGTDLNVRGQFEKGQTGAPFYIDSEGQITLGGADPNALNNNNAIGMNGASSPSTRDDFNYMTSKTLPASFPKGYNAFYCMKYEITQGQYADFLNKLSLTQATERYMGLYSADFQTINGAHPNFVAQKPNRTLVQVHFLDIFAYLDWTGLRPMTELEYEKVCRGSRGAGILPVQDEFAWGSQSIKSGTYILSDNGAPNETVNTEAGVGNAICSTTRPINAPIRVGAIAAGMANPDRQEAGATYYGVMEMSGNQSELVINIGNEIARDYDGKHGDGYLTSTGNADVEEWPVSTVLATGLRGGSYYSTMMDLRTSDRINARYYNATSPVRQGYIGGRGVRTAD